MGRADTKVGDLPAGKADAASPDQLAGEVEAAFRILNGRWKIMIIFHLFEREVLRFSELERAIPAVSQKVLTRQLRELERDGVVQRMVYAEVPPKVEYRVTEWGRALCPGLNLLIEWAAARPRRSEGALPSPARG